MTKQEAIEILGEAESGVVTLDDRFKEACKLGKQALIKEEANEREDTN